MTPLWQKYTGNREDPKIELNSCFSDFSDSLNSLNSMSVLLHSGKTPLDSIGLFQRDFGVLIQKKSPNDLLCSQGDERIQSRLLDLRKFRSKDGNRR